MTCLRKEDSKITVQQFYSYYDEVWIILYRYVIESRAYRYEST